MFYAIDCPFGLGVVSDDNALIKFETEEMRDAWVAEDKTDYYGNNHREAISEEDARNQYPDEF